MARRLPQSGRSQVHLNARPLFGLFEISGVSVISKISPEWANKLCLGSDDCCKLKLSTDAISPESCRRTSRIDSRCKVRVSGSAVIRSRQLVENQRMCVRPKRAYETLCVATHCEAASAVGMMGQNWQGAAHYWT
jgi:hypothetical protein